MEEKEFKNYVGTKIIKAKKVTFEEYVKLKYGKDFIYTGKMSLVSEVYIVIYPPIGDETKPYISMSPVEVFEKAYRQIEDAELSLCMTEKQNI